MLIAKKKKLCYRDQIFQWRRDTEDHRSEPHLVLWHPQHLQEQESWRSCSLQNTQRTWDMLETVVRWVSQTDNLVVWSCISPWSLLDLVELPGVCPALEAGNIIVWWTWWTEDQLLEELVTVGEYQWWTGDGSIQVSETTASCWHWRSSWRRWRQMLILHL